MDLGLKDRVCIVTGAGRGIGNACARLLCRESAGVLAVARSEEDLRALVGECDSRDGSVVHLSLDITEKDAGERMVSEAEEKFGKVDVLVNNAGTAKWRHLDELDDEDWQKQWELNVMGPMRAMQAAVPGMRERGYGRIVNVSSSAGKRPSGYMPEYSVTKAAMLSLSRLYADYYAKEGVLVNAVCPGPVEGSLWMDEGGLADQLAKAEGLSRDQALAKAASGRPIGRLASEAEIAKTIVFLCSEAASYVAGAAWSVDGGTVQVII